MQTIIHLFIAYKAISAAVGIVILAAGTIAAIRNRRADRRWLNTIPARKH